MKDAKGHGSNPRGGSGQFQTTTGISRAAKERQAILSMIDQRKFAATRTSNRNLTPDPDAVARARVQSMGLGLHSAGIERATAGKSLTLAETSALGATTANINKSGGN